MTTRSKRTPKLLSLLLSTCMALSMIPLSALAADGDITIDETNFPDANFRTYVQKFDVERDSVLSKQELADVHQIGVVGNSISSLKGVEHFTALTQLFCDDNQLTELDVSKNTALTKLHCSSNQLTELDISKNTALTHLECNENQLTELDVTQNTALKMLQCDDNQLTQLDVTNNTALDTLFCSGNQLTQLDTSNNTVLDWLLCYDNQLTQLDISKNTAMTHLECSSNQLSQLDVTKNTILERLYFNDNRLTQLDVTNNPVLSDLGCRNNQLTQLDVTKNALLKDLFCANNQLTQLDLSKNFTLSRLDCSQNQLSQLDVIKNTALTRLECSSNQLSQLDVTKNTALARLECNNNQLTSLDLSHNPKLIEFELNGNGITINQKDGFDCTTLPGSFDVSKVSNVSGGTFDADTHTFSFDADAESATYEYDTGYTGTTQLTPAKFTLVYEAPEVPEVPDPEPTENPFNDVPTDRYFYEPVLWAVKNNITSGVSDTEFGPYEACTRAQIATFLWASAGRPDPETTENPFTDVKESDYFYKAVLWAAENGITSGVSENEFGPYEVCTRAQAVTLLWAGEGKPVVESGTSFNDVAQGDYFYDAVQWAVKNNVTAGIGDGCFGPADNCQRGQIVTFMYKTFA